MKIEKFKTKDFVFTGIIAAIYTALSLIVGVVSNTVMPVVAHAFSSSVVALLFGGVIILFLIKQVPKFGVLSLLFFVLMLIFTLLGMGYLPWFLSSMTGAVLADLIAATSQYQSRWKNALGYGIMQVGLAAGGIIPAWFFADSFRKTWVEKGMSDTGMIEESIQLYTSYMGGVILLTSFLGGFFGIYVGYKILEKHFRERE